MVRHKARLTRVGMAQTQLRVGMSSGDATIEGAMNWVTSTPKGALMASVTVARVRCDAQKRTLARVNYKTCDLAKIRILPVHLRTNFESLWWAKPRIWGY